MNIGELIRKLLMLWYNRQLDRYYVQLEALDKKREQAVKPAFENEQQSNVSEDLLSIVKNVIDSIEDEEKERLRKRYKNALTYGEMRFGAGIGSLNGFKFVVHSNDHDQHFHVIHMGRGIDARFSFPQLELVSYKKNGNLISSKEEKKLAKALREKVVFRKLKLELDKRS